MIPDIRVGYYEDGYICNVKINGILLDDMDLLPDGTQLVDGIYEPPQEIRYSQRRLQEVNERLNKCIDAFERAMVYLSDSEQRKYRAVGDWLTSKEEELSKRLDNRCSMFNVIGLVSLFCLAHFFYNKKYYI